MKLQGILQIAFRFERQLDLPTCCHILRHLLPANGGADELDEFLWINVFPTPIRETENHILMIQSARYLSNSLFKKWSGDCPGAKKWNAWEGVDADNDANGMTDWWLRELQRLMVEDFYEFNSRPYAEHAQQPIRNLFEFAEVPGVCQHNKGAVLVGAVKKRCDVRRAARNVLDYNAARFATSSNNFRRATPFRRHMDERPYTRLVGRHGDRIAQMSLGYARTSPLTSLHGRQLNQSLVDALVPVTQSLYKPSYVVTRARTGRISTRTRHPVSPTVSSKPPTTRGASRATLPMCWRRIHNTPSRTARTTPIRARMVASSSSFSGTTSCTPSSASMILAHPRCRSNATITNGHWPPRVRRATRSAACHRRGERSAATRSSAAASSSTTPG